MVIIVFLLQVNKTLRDFHFIPNLQASESRSSLTCAVPCRLNYNTTAQVSEERDSETCSLGRNENRSI